VAAVAELWLSGEALSDLPGIMAKVATLVFGSYATIWKAWKVSDQIEAKING
jgi:hypothetical protein